MKREFTGVFIPAKIWCDEELTPAEKMLLGEVKALSERTGWCTANNRHFSSWLHCSLPNVSMYINGLSKKGYLIVEYDNEKTKSGRKMQVNSTWYHGIQDDLTPLSLIEGGLSQVEAPLSQIEAEIQYKDNLKPSVSVAHAQNENDPNPLEAEKIPPPVAAAPPAGPGLRDYPKAGTDTPTKLLAELRRLYAANPEEWRATIEGTPAMNWPDKKRSDVIAKFCDHAIFSGWENRPFKQINARLKQWLKDEKYMDRTGSSQTEPPRPRRPILT